MNFDPTTKHHFHTHHENENNTNVLKMNLDQYAQHIKVFDLIDKEHKGRLDRENFITLRKKYNFGPSWTLETLGSVFDQIDEKHTGMIELHDYLNVLDGLNPNKNLKTLIDIILTKTRYHEQYESMGPVKYATEVLGMSLADYQKYQEIFDQFDINDNKGISKDEFISVIEQYLGPDVFMQDIEDIFLEFDKNDNGKITFFDFLTYMVHGPPNPVFLGFVSSIYSKTNEIRSNLNKFPSKHRCKSEPEEPMIDQPLEEFIGRESEPMKQSQNLENMNPEEYAIKKLRMTQAQFDRYKFAYELLNLNDSDKISKFDFEQAIGFLGLASDLTQKELDDCFARLDKDQDKYINLNDFLREINSRHLFEILARLFREAISKKDEINNYRKEKGKEERHPRIVDYKKEAEIDMNALAYARESLNMEEDYLQKLIKAYKQIDLSERSLITKADFDGVLKKFSLTDILSLEEFESLFNEIDKDNDEKISLLDFLKCVGDENHSNKFRQIFEPIFKKIDKSLQLKNNEDPTKHESARTSEQSIIRNDAPKDEKERSSAQEKKRIQKDYKSQIEEFMWWLDSNNLLETNNKETLVKSLTTLQQNLEDKLELSKEEKINNLGLFLEIMGNELKQQISLKRRINELTTALEEERGQNQGEGKEMKLKTLVLNSKKRKNLEDLKRGYDTKNNLEKDIALINEPAGSNFKIMEEKFKNEIHALRKTIGQKDAMLNHRDLIIEEKNREIHMLHISKQELEVKLKVFEEEVMTLRQENQQNLSFGPQMGELDKLVRQFEDVKIEKIGIEKENRKLIDKIKELEQERAQLHQDLNMVKKDLETVYRNEDERRTQIEELCKQVKDSVDVELYKTVTQERDVLTQENSYMRNELMILKRNNSVMKEEKKRLQTQVHDLETEKANLRETCNGINEDLKRVIQDVEGFEAREKEYLKKIEELNVNQEKFRQLEEEVQMLRQTINSSKRNVEQKRSQSGKENLNPNVKVFQESEALGGEKSNIQVEFANMKKELEEFKKKELYYEECFSKLSNDKLRQEYNVLVDRLNVLESENEEMRQKIKERSDDMSGSKHLHSLNLIEEINQVENNLKNLQKKENAYKQEIEGLSRELQLFTSDAENLKVDNNRLKNQILDLKNEVAHVSLANSNLKEVNQKLYNEINLLHQSLQEVKEDKKKYLHVVQSLNSPEYKSLKEEHEKLKLEHQSLKVKNLVLEDRIEMLEKQRQRMDSQTYSQDQALIENIEKDKQDLRREILYLRQQIDDFRRQQQNQLSFYETPSKKFTPSKKDIYQKSAGPGESTYLEAIEKLRDELRNVRESREAILHSLEKDRGTIRNVIEDIPKSGTKYSYSDKKTPNKFEIASTEVGQMEGTRADPTARKMNFNDLINKSAPETIKKVASRPIHTFGAHQSLSGQKGTPQSGEKSHIFNPSIEYSPKISETTSDSSRFAFQILYWLTDNTLLTRELCAICPMSKLDELEIKQILREIQIFGDRAKSYYKSFITGDTKTETKLLYDFVLPLFSRCYRSHTQLKDIQTRVINRLKEIAQSNSIVSSS